MTSLSYELSLDWVEDKDFQIFGAVDSETDELPTGTERQSWSKSAWIREDEKIAAYENVVNDEVRQACKNVINRFGNSH